MDAVKRSKEIFEQEISELQILSNKIGVEMNAVVEMIYACKGKLDRKSTRLNSSH